MGQHIPVTPGNIAPLALERFQPGRLALVCEGGGQRGIFTAGVLDEFLRADFDPFDCYYGTSAGAQNLSAFLCRQPGYAHQVITRFTTTRDFFNPLRFVRGGNLIDLDWLLDATSRKMPLAMDNAARLFDSGRQFYMCASRSNDYAPAYFSPTHDNWLELIRASSAIPGFYRTKVEIDGVGYQDGGISDAVPVREAARQGADTLVVIRTVPSHAYYTPRWFKRMERWLSEGSLQPLVNLVNHHQMTYNETQQFIESPPDNLRIFEIYPSRPLHSMALGSSQTALGADYGLGRQCARYFLATVGKWLAGTPGYPRITLPKAALEATAVIASQQAASSAGASAPLQAAVAGDNIVLPAQGIDVPLPQRPKAVPSVGVMVAPHTAVPPTACDSENPQ